ncbi:hypothetical protein [Peribacillus loiseleuriae]|uniref:hypothetical protein n=1 Tax=Peribacillus loiseleuriae TaxID=1679170 RepID=UPI003D0394AA
MEIFSVIGYVLVLIVLGCLPVINKMSRNQKPTPYGHSWAPIISPESQVLGVTEAGVTGDSHYDMEQDFSYLVAEANQISIQPEIPSYSEDSIPAYVNEAKREHEMVHSVPTEDMFENIKQLVSTIEEGPGYDSYDHYFSFEPEIVNRKHRFENVQIDASMPDNSPLTKSEFDSITKKYGRDIAKLITTTPSMSIKPGTHQVMIGRISIGEDGSIFLNYREDKVKLSGSAPKYDREVMLVKGHCIKEGDFRVMSWDDAETLAHMNHQQYMDEYTNEQAAVI